MLEQYNEAFWFFGGAFSYRILAGLLTYGHMGNLVRSINEELLKMLGTVAEDIAFIRNMKYVTLSETSLEKEQINKIKILDDRSFHTWRSTCIAKMLIHCPKIYRHTIKYSDWDEAMKELEKIYKRGLKGTGHKIEKEKK